MKLSQKHFKLFRAECEKQLEWLGLKNWKVYYQFKRLDDAFAHAQWKYAGRVATITLNTEFEKPFDNLKQQIKQSALHECLELLLSPLSNLAGDRSFCQADFEKEVHSIIRILEKLL